MFGSYGRGSKTSMLNEPAHLHAQGAVQPAYRLGQIIQYESGVWHPRVKNVKVDSQIPCYKLKSLIENKGMDTRSKGEKQITGLFK